MSQSSLSKQAPLSRRRRLVFIAILQGVILCLLIAVAEFGLRIYIAARGWTTNCYSSELDLFVPHPECGTTLRPGYRLRSGVWQISINHLGLRGPEVTSEKPAGIRRVAILGESSTFGYLVNDGEEAARLLERSLRESGEQIEVLNAGVPSYNMFQSRVRFREVIAPLKPDLVICYLGWNDLGYVVSPTPDAPLFRKRAIASSAERLLSNSVLYSFVTRRLLQPVATLPPAVLSQYTPTAEGEAQFRENLKGLLQEIKQAGAIPVLCSQASAARPDVDPALRSSLGRDADQSKMIELGEWLRRTESQLTTQLGFLYVDISEAIAPSPVYLADQIHLTREGEAKLAAQFHEIVIQELCQ